MPYNAGASGGSNQGPLNPALADAVKGRIEALRAADPGNTRAGAGRPGHRLGQRPRPAHQRRRRRDYQVARVAQGARPAADAGAARWSTQHTEGRTFGVLGEPRVNVLQLNLALDRDRRDRRYAATELAGSALP